MKWLCLIGALSAALILGCGSVDTSGDGGGGQDGSCTATSPCPKGGVCLFGENACGADAKGTCQAAFSCDGPPTGPVCQCDGEVIEGETASCTLIAKGQPSADAEVCAKGTFTCGPTSCKRNVEVCVLEQGGPAGTQPSYTCTAVKDLQGTCTNGIADCSCLDASSLGCAGGSCCKADADHQETITISVP